MAYFGKLPHVQTLVHSPAFAFVLPQFHRFYTYCIRPIIASTSFLHFCLSCVTRYTISNIFIEISERTNGHSEPFKSLVVSWRLFQASRTPHIGFHRKLLEAPGSHTCRCISRGVRVLLHKWRRRKHHIGVTEFSPP